MQGWNWVKGKEHLQQKRKKKTQVERRKKDWSRIKRETDFAQCMTFSSKRETDRAREGKGSVMKPIRECLAANNMLVLNMVLSLCNPNYPHTAIQCKTQTHILYTFRSISHTRTSDIPTHVQRHRYGHRCTCEAGLHTRTCTHRDAQGTNMHTARGH